MASKISSRIGEITLKGLEIVVFLFAFVIILLFDNWLARRIRYTAEIVLGISLLVIFLFYAWLDRLLTGEEVITD